MRTAVLSEEADEAEYQSLSPTIEAEEKLDELINRAEKTASDRARILKRIRVDALDVHETLEEVRWRFCELSKGKTSINEAGQNQSHVIETNKSRSRTESRGSYQEKECPEASGENRESRKEKEEVYQEAALGRHLEERESSSGKTAGKRVLNVNEQSNEELLENTNKTTRGVEFDGELYKLGRPIQSGTTDSLKKSEGKSIGSTKGGQCRTRRKEVRVIKRKDLNNRENTKSQQRLFRQRKANENCLKMGH